MRSAIHALALALALVAGSAWAEGPATPPDRDLPAGLELTPTVANTYDPEAWAGLVDEPASPPPARERSKLPAVAATVVICAALALYVRKVSRDRRKP
jgi:hypothetical protein